MGRNYDNAPVGNTCPMINEVIDAISADFSEDGYHSKKELIDIMEKIRSANLELRNWGNELHRDTESKDREIATLERENERLQDEINHLTKELQSIE